MEGERHTDATSSEDPTELLSEALVTVDQYHDSMESKTIFENADDYHLEDRKEHALKFIDDTYKEPENFDDNQDGSYKAMVASQITFDVKEKQPRKTFGPCRFLDHHCKNQAVYKKTRYCEKHYRKANARKKCIKCRKQNRGFLEHFCDECLKKKNCKTCRNINRTRFDECSECRKKNDKTNYPEASNSEEQQRDDIASDEEQPQADNFNNNYGEC